MSVTYPDTADTAPSISALDALRSIDWLGDVMPATLERLAAHAIVIRLPRGAEPFEQAETPAFAAFLLAGSIELLGVGGDEEALIELIQPVDIVLPAAILTNAPCLVRARVREDAALLLVPAELFRAAVVADQALSLAMIACLSAQLRRQMKLTKAARLRSAEQRVGRYLLGLAETAPDGNAIPLPIEKGRIAAQLGMTRETLSRVLRTLRDKGISLADDRLSIDDHSVARCAFPYDPLIDAREPISPLRPGDVE